MSDDSMVLAAAAVAITTICAGVVAHHDPDPPETEATTADAVTAPAALSGGNPETRKMECRQISAGELICKLGGTDNASNDD